MKLAQKVITLIESSIQDSVKRGAKDDNLVFEKADPDHCVCSIAFSEKNNTWYGFSHRALHGFTEGDKLFDEKWDGGLEEAELEKMPFRKRGAVVIATMEQAKQAAKNFARYVS